MSGANASDTSPSVAIILPTYNRPERLAQCLEHLAHLDGGPYRTVVVDDGGNVPVSAICRPHSAFVEVIRRANGGPAAARNTGAQAAKGADLLAFLDDDCRPHGDWIVRLVEAHAGVSNRLVGGRVENALPDNVCSSASQTLCSYLYDYYRTSGSDMTFFTSNNMLCSRDRFLRCGAFDEDFPIPAGEDRDFGIRWQDHGGELRYAPDAVVDHAHDLSLAQFWRQHSNYGRGARQLHVSMNQRGDQRAKLERGGFYLGMFTYPFRTHARRPLTQAALLGLSQAATIAGYAQALLAERRSRSATRASA